MGMQGLDEIHTRWLYRRVFDFAATLTGVAIKINGKSTQALCKGAKDYIAAQLLGMHEKDQKQDAAEEDAAGGGGFGDDEDANASDDDDSEEEEHMESESEEGGRATPSKKGRKLSAEERKARRPLSAR
jgi:hypothetical protein